VTDERRQVKHESSKMKHEKTAGDGEEIFREDIVKYAFVFAADNRSDSRLDRIAAIALIILNSERWTCVVIGIDVKMFLCFFINV